MVDTVKLASKSLEILSLINSIVFDELCVLADLQHLVENALNLIGENRRRGVPLLLWSVSIYYLFNSLFDFLDILIVNYSFN